MKTGISIPDEVFASADALARRLDISRSELYSNAVAEYVAKHRDEDVTARLDAVYAKLPGRIDTGLRQIQAQSVQGDW